LKGSCSTRRVDHLQGVPRGRPQRKDGRTAALPADPQLRARITAATNKGESYNGFSHWLAFGNTGVLADNDPAEQEKLIKLNTLLANLVIFHNALDVMDVVRKLVAEGWLITADQLGAMSPYLRGPHQPVRRLRHRRPRPPARGLQPGSQGRRLHWPSPSPHELYVLVLDAKH
jgi:hypothetical protein